MDLIGRGSLLLAFGLAVYATAAGWMAGRRRDRRLLDSGRRALLAAFAAVVVASAVFMWAIQTHDYRFLVVWRSSSDTVPQPYLTSSFWTTQQGSLLLWLLVLTGLSALVTWQNRRRNHDLMPWVVAILGAACAFFAFTICFIASPFESVGAVVPTAGRGMVASLQNPYNMIHPPMLYLGYVGFTVPFAFAMSALLAGRADERWIQLTRRWTLVPWLALGLGMLLGAKWAYEEIGWGGFWGWDPVENAALIPWLTATAFLHSVIVQEKKGMLRVWNVSLVALTYVLCITGTFFTRSGFTSSIHTFARSSIGWWFVAWIGIVAVFAIVVISRNAHRLRSPHRIESPVSREATFLFNNLLFVALAFAVLWGILFPPLSEAVGGHKIQTATPYYNFFAVAIGLPLLLLMGIGPVIAWRRASRRGLVQAFRWPFLCATAGIGLLLLAGFGSSVPGVIALSLCLFVAVSILLEIGRGASARRRLAPGTPWAAAVLQLIARNRRRYGGYVVHLAIVIGILAIVGTSAYATVRQPVLQPGQSFRIHGYTLTFVRLTTGHGPNWNSTNALIEVRRGGKLIDTVRPGKRSYTDAPESSQEVSIRPSWSGEDLYIAFNGAVRGTGVNLKVLVNPLVNLLWLAGLVLIAGFGIAVWPDARVAARVARRTDELARTASR